MAPVAAKSQASERGAVLVVDDNPGVLQMLQVVVTTMGYDVDVAETGHEALPLLAGRDYDAVVCDVLMPGMRGDELFWACHQRKPMTAQRFIFLTGSPELCHEPSPVDNTGQPWLAKPCHLVDLRRAIDSVQQTA